MKKRWSFLMLAALAAAACDDDRPAGVDAGPLDAAAEVAADAGLVEAGADSAVAIPAGNAGAALAWFIDLINGPPQAITEAALAGHFHDSFVAQVPLAALAELFQDIARSEAPVRLRAVDPGPAAGGLTAVVVTRRGLYQRVLLTMDAVMRDQLVGLLIQGAPAQDPEAQSFAAITTRAAAAAARVRMYIGRIDGTACQAVAAAGAGESMPLGSLFKIYVLGAVANRVLDGGAMPLTWGQELLVDEALRSWPSGQLQNAPAGSPIALDTAAGQMISISDNTATDHLLALVGRPAVEAIQAPMGHTQPALNQPFLSTRELFIMKVVATPDERKAFVAAPLPERRRLLAEVHGKRPLPPLAAAAEWTSPRDIETLEWFASPEDVCRGFAWLGQQGQRPGGAPILNALSKNPGIPIDKAIWIYAGYKGGSEPGVLTMSWLLRRRADNAWFNVTTGFADPTRPVDEALAVYLSQALVDLAAR